jgi:hypothetical protein
LNLKCLLEQLAAVIGCAAKLLIIPQGALEALIGGIKGFVRVGDGLVVGFVLSHHVVVDGLVRRPSYMPVGMQIGAVSFRRGERGAGETVSKPK